MKLNKWKGVAITAVFSIVTSFTPSMQTIEAVEIYQPLHQIKHVLASKHWKLKVSSDESSS